MFTKWSTCVFYREELEKVFFKQGNTAMLKEDQRKHWKFVEAERVEYAVKRDRTSREPNNYCSVIVDGADQSAFGMPHFANNTKNMRGEKMKVRVIGLKEHLSYLHIMLFLLTEEHETGANHVIECPHRFLTAKSQ